MFVRAVTLSFALIVGWLSPSAARACSCVQQTLAQAREASAAIFEGRVLSVSEPAPLDGEGIPMRKVRVQVVQRWKGTESAETLELITAAQASACGYGFKQGQSYLIYAYQAGERLGVSSCGRTRLRAEAGEDLAALGAGVATVARPKSSSAGAKASTPTADKPAPAPAQRGGCASCSVAEGRGGPQGLALVAALLWLTRRRTGAAARR